MAVKVYWLFGFVALYWLYCMYWGVRGMRTSRTATDYFLAGRRIPTWVFIMAATATSFSGWTFMGHPGLLFADGFPYAFASFYAIIIPLAGVLFLKRQWMLGKRFGYVTPGEMFADYFKGDGIRVLTVIVALLFSIPHLGLQFRASGFLFEVLTDGIVPLEAGMWVLAVIVLLYVVTGGLRAVAYVDTVQCLLLAAGMIVTGMIALQAIGGWGAFIDGLGQMATTPEIGPDKFQVPGIIQFNAGVGVQDPIGGIWTGVMILTYMIALMGVQAAPAFSMWAFGNADPKPFAPQQVWASSLLIGGIMFVFGAIQGMGGHLLGADPAVNAAGIAVASVLPESIAAKPDTLVPYYFNIIADDWPWLVGLLSVCALAAMQSTGATYMSTAGAMLTRDVYKRYLHPSADHTIQKFFGRIGVVLITLAALVVATVTEDTLVLLGGLAVAFGVQMLPTLAAICYFPWLTRQGCTWGLGVGLVVVAMTDSVGVTLQMWLLGDPIWGRWPLTLHSAGWGLAANLLVALALSAATQSDQGATEARRKFHDFLDAHARLSPSKKKLIPLAWAAALTWMVFAIGPGTVIGNDLFGAPQAGPEGWLFGIPSIWAWQLLFWLLGVALMWGLAYKMEMSTVPQTAFEALVEDIGDLHEPIRR